MSTRIGLLSVPVLKTSSLFMSVNLPKALWLRLISIVMPVRLYLL